MRTSEERKRLHLEMWKRIADTGCDKYDAIRAIGGIYDHPSHNCFACEEAGIPKDRPSDSGEWCLECPVIWGTETSHHNTFCQRNGGAYRLYVDGDYKLAAQKILKLKFKGAWADKYQFALGQKVYFRDGHSTVVETFGFDGIFQLRGISEWFTQEGKLRGLGFLGQVIFTEPPVEKAEQPKKKIVSMEQIIKDVRWKRWNNNPNNPIYPFSSDPNFTDWYTLPEKPKMTMILRWEEEQ